MELIERINTVISQRTSYGIRTEIAQSRGYRMVWSNAGQRWSRFYYMDKKGAELRMDANFVFIPLEKSERKADIDRCLALGVRGLPLFVNSFEARFKH